MRFSVSRESLLKPLQLAAGVVERRSTKDVLKNVLVQLQDGVLSLTGSDNEVEIIARIHLDTQQENGAITVPAKKFLDICKSLHDGTTVDFAFDGTKVTIKSGRSRFSLNPLAADDYPLMAPSEESLSFIVLQKEIKRIISTTSFAMAQQDVRFYLNGMLWEVRADSLRAVATDGHRLAMCTRPISCAQDGLRQVIVPRKAVVELSRLLNTDEDPVDITLSNNTLCVVTPDFTFTSKLVDARFPDYERVLPRGGDKILVGNRDDFKQGFTRTAILCNDKYRGVRFALTPGLVTLTTSNNEQDEAEEQVFVDYEGEPLEMGFNVSYLLDVTTVMESDSLCMTLADDATSALLTDPNNPDVLYVVMPMRL